MPKIITKALLIILCILVIIGIILTLLYIFFCDIYHGKIKCEGGVLNDDTVRIPRIYPGTYISYEMQLYANMPDIYYLDFYINADKNKLTDDLIVVLYLDNKEIYNGSLIYLIDNPVYDIPCELNREDIALFKMLLTMPVNSENILSDYSSIVLDIQGTTIKGLRRRLNWCKRKIYSSAIVQEGI